MIEAKNIEISQRKYFSKLLLFGEYTVTTGSGALAIPYWPFFGQWAYHNKISLINNGLVKLLNFLTLSSECNEIVNIRSFKQDMERGLFFNSNIPLGYGLGSSGALVAAFFEKYSKVDSKSLQEIKTYLAMIECGFHGSSSGIDPLVSYLGLPVFLDENKFVSPLENLVIPEGFFILDTGKSRETEPLVQYYKEKIKNDLSFSNAVTILADSNKMAIQSLIKNDIYEYWKALDKISFIQMTFMSYMITDEFKPLWKEGINSDYFKLKLCGAGGGGMILGFTSDRVKFENEHKNYTFIFL